MEKRIAYKELKDLIERAGTTRMYISGASEKHYLRCNILSEGILCVGVDAYGHESKSVELKEDQTIIYDRGSVRIVKTGKK